MTRKIRYAVVAAATMIGAAMLTPAGVPDAHAGKNIAKVVLQNKHNRRVTCELTSASGAALGSVSARGASGRAPSYAGRSFTLPSGVTKIYAKCKDEKGVPSSKRHVEVDDKQSWNVRLQCEHGPSCQASGTPRTGQAA